MALRMHCVCIAIVFIRVEGLRKTINTIGNPWSVEAHQMPDGFDPIASNLSVMTTRFDNSVGKAKKFMEEAIIDQSDPFPNLDQFFIFSRSTGRWFAFRREDHAPKIFSPLSVGTSPHVLPNGNILRQLIVTVQRTRQDLFCKMTVDNRIDCAIAHDRLRGFRWSRPGIASAGSWWYSPVQKGDAAGVKDLTATFGGSVSNATNELLKHNGRDVHVHSFTITSRSKGTKYIFKQFNITPQERVQFALDYKGKEYPPHVCPGSLVNKDVVIGKVFPFPGASSWQLQSKWVSQGKPIAASPIFDMEDNWTDAMQKLNDEHGRVRVYFVGHSANLSDFFGDRTGRAYNSTTVAQKLEAAGMSSTKPITLSFVACNGASLFCPSLAKKLQDCGYRNVHLYCREPQAERYSGGPFMKRVIGPKGRRTFHKLHNSKTMFFTGASNPRQGVFAY
jgi:hypothetical protein